MYAGFIFVNLSHCGAGEARSERAPAVIGVACLAQNIYDWPGFSTEEVPNVVGIRFCDVKYHPKPYI